MMWGWPENAFSWTTSSSFNACRVTMSPIFERTSSNAGLRSPTPEIFGWEITRIIANWPERIVQVESSILHPCSKRTRLTSATIPGLSLPTTLIEKCPIPGSSFHADDFEKSYHDAVPHTAPVGSIQDGEEGIRLQNADLFSLHPDFSFILQFFQCPRKRLGDGPQAGSEDGLADVQIEHRPVPARHPPDGQLFGEIPDQARLDVPQ